MAPVSYRFGEFHLDPKARELRQHEKRISLPVSTLDCLTYLVQHRNRSIGRDELTAAVWGRTDVSDVSLNHAIMRLRRLLGDAGNEQRCIRTVPRLGYRWIFEPTIEELGTSPSHAENAAAVASEPIEQARRDETSESKSRWRLLAAAAVLIVAAACIAIWFVDHNVRDVANTATLGSAHPPAMVVPAAVDAPGEWAWLRLGFMELVANQLRDAGLPTTPSETVVGLINAKKLDADAARADPSIINPTTLVVKPNVALANGLWNVRLVAHRRDRDLIAEAQGADVLSAGRAAADKLLSDLGLASAPTGNSSMAVDELARRVSAAALAGQLDAARDLIERASPDARASPEISLSLATIEFFSGQYDASRARAEALLDQLPADRDAHLRARVLNELGVIYFRQNQFDQADAAFSESIRLLQLVNDPEALAAAYTGRGVVAGQEGRLDAATSFLGQARLLHEMSNDAFGVARVDLNLGAIAMDRGQPLVAAPLFEKTAERFEQLSTPEARNSALRSLADTYSMLLEHDKALATTDRLWPPEAQGPNPRERWWITLSRAVALAGVGRLSDADTLLRDLEANSDASKDAAARVEGAAVSADIAMLRGNYAEAASLAKGALMPILESTNGQDYLGTWCTRIRALQRLGDAREAATEIDLMKKWVAKSPTDRRELYATLAEADQAALEQRTNDALARYADALARAERLGIPEDIVIVGQPYVNVLVDAGQLDQASAIAGRLAPWSTKDMRAALVEARVYEVLHKADSARASFERARAMAGERVIASSQPTR